MKMHPTILYACLLLVTGLNIIACSDSPITEYVARDLDEEEIISVLTRYRDAKNHVDVDRFLSLLDDRGAFAFQCGRMVTKAVLKAELPGFWAAIQAGDATVFPIVHECINGDYYKTGELNNPQIQIKNDNATVTVLFTNGVCRVPLHLSMIRKNDRWLINQTQWGDG